MALGFLSSPPHPTSNPWQQTTTQFFTPQRSLRRNWNATATQTSPSPLRTSRNANLMSSPNRGGKTFDEVTFPDHNAGDENTGTTDTIPTATQTSKQEQSSIFSDSTSGLANPFTVQPSTFFLGPSTSTTTSTQVPPARTTHFRYESRARTSAPTALLQSHARDSRDSRKRVFLDRLRNRRDDARSDRTGDQVLRMDYLEERRRWEAEKQSAAGADPEPWDVDVDLLDDDGAVDELSPVDEEGELEEWAALYRQMEEEEEKQKNQGFGGDGGNGLGENDDFGDFSDEAYDELFGEVLSQQEGGLADGAAPRYAVHGALSSDTALAPVPYGSGGVDAEMDMS